jgi:aspartate carbamoyltransferase catalytic subunit
MSQLTSLLDLRSLTLSQIHSLFSLAKKLKSPSSVSPRSRLNDGKTIGLLFFEASTRTRMSFETAAHRIGLGPLLLDGGVKSSLEKGESVEDSILNVAAMNPSFLVIRCGDSVDLKGIAQQVGISILNAGWGVKGHPTQALLDVFTMQETLGDLSGKKVLFIGDIRHSRVAASHFELAKTMNVELAVCAPADFLPSKDGTAGSVKSFEDLDQGLAWADVAIALRCQFERHQSGFKIFSAEDYRKNYGLNSLRLRNLKKNGLIMHPGPINHGIELESEVLKDPRCRVLEQVSNGVHIRESILRSILEGVL